MRRLKITVLLISLITTLAIEVKSETIEVKKFEPCNPATATDVVTNCPKNARCVENGTVDGKAQGFCVCGPSFEVNQNFIDKKSEYCIEKKIEVQTNETITAPTTLAPAVSSSTSTPTVGTPTTTTTTVKPEAKTTAKAEVTTSTTTLKPEVVTTTKSETTEQPEDKNAVKVAPAPHHIVGGILLPIFIVLAFIGTVFAVRKYDLIERAHGFIRHRHQETRYNGLMENDFDDDPLLI